MWMIKDLDLGVLRGILSHMREFIKHHEIFCQLKIIFVDSVVGYLAICQMMLVSWGAAGCVVLLSYPCDTGVVRPLKVYCASWRDHGEPAKRFLPTVAVVCLGRFIRNENAQRKLQVYCDEYNCYTLPGLLSKAVADDLDAVYNGKLDDGDCVVQ